jgi:hypothetical protein
MTYESVDSLIEAVQSFVHERQVDGRCSFTGFKIDIYFGRGVHTFALSADATKHGKRPNESKADHAEKKRSKEEATPDSGTVR